MDYDLFILSFISLFTIINPFSTASVFLSITPDYTRAERKVTAMKAMFISIIILLIFAFLGKGILNFFSISIDGMRIAGGLLVASTGWKMINQKRKRIHSQKEREELMEKEDISIVPLAIPLISGPGAITTIMVLIHDASTFTQTLYVVAAAIIACALTGIALLESHYFERLLGHSGKKVMGKIMGLIVLFIGVQFIIAGMHNLLLSWGIIAL